MAKKKKNNVDDNEDINEGRSGDINEADDNFGLPEVEYTPVKRDEPAQPTHRHEPEEEPERNPEEEPAIESEYTSTPPSEPASTETTEETTYVKSAATPPPTEDDNYRYRRYNEEKENSNAPKIIIILALLLLVAAAIWYLGFYRPGQEQLRLQEEQARARQEQIDRDQQAAQAERERQEREEAQREADRLAAEQAAAEAEPQIGTVETISNRTGRYYIVVASALDGDLAMDYAKKLNLDGKNIKILEPFGNSKFHRVAVADFDSWAGAQDQANELKGTYGDEVWVVKY